MAVTVVRGFVGKSSKDGGSNRQANSASSNQTPQNHSALNASVSLSSEAVVSSIRVTKPVAPGERIRVVADAEKLSLDVAERIAKDEGAEHDAHSNLSPDVARAHFA